MHELRQGSRGARTRRKSAAKRPEVHASDEAGEDFCRRGAQRRKRSQRVVLQQADVEHLELDENAPESHEGILRGHKTDAQNFNGHEHA